MGCENGGWNTNRRMIKIYIYSLCKYKLEYETLLKMNASFPSNKFAVHSVDFTFYIISSSFHVIFLQINSRKRKL